MGGELSRLRRLITDSHNFDELRTLCFDLGIDFDELGDGGKSARVRELILLLGRQHRYDELIEALKEGRGMLFETEFLDKLYKSFAEGTQQAEDVEPSSLNIQEKRPKIRFFCNVPYGMEANFSGRKEELTQLDEWLKNDTESPAFLIQAIGGNGKSALAWYWQHTLRVSPQENSLKRILWWSFYEDNADIRRFVEEALSWFEYETGGLDSDLMLLNHLTEFFDKEPMLIILDGVERLLQAYAFAAVDPNVVDGEKSSPLTGFDARDCADPISNNFLIRLTELVLGKSLLLSRMVPLVFEGRSGSLIRGVKFLELSGLTPNDVRVFFEKEGVKATLSEVEFIGQPIAFHPLSLRLIAGYIKDDPELSNNLVEAVDYDPTDDLIGRKEHILARAYDSLPESTQKLLGRLSVFYESVKIDKIKLVAHPMDPPSSERKIKHLPYVALQDVEAITNTSGHLRILRHRGLIQQARYQNQTYYFLHPIIRRYAYQRSDEVKAIHAQLVFHYSRHLKTNYTSQEKTGVETHREDVTELNNKIQIYLHTISLEMYDLAYIFLKEMLDLGLRFKLGNYSLFNRLLSLLFSKNDDLITNLEDENNEAGALLMLANSYLGMGWPSQALHLGKFIAGQTKFTLPTAFISSHGLLSSTFKQLGQLMEANWHRQFELELFKKIVEEFGRDDDQFHLAISHQELGYLQSLFGNWEQAESEYHTALNYYISTERQQSEHLIYAYQAFNLLLQEKGQLAHTFGQKAYEIAVTRQNQIDRIRIEWLLGWNYLQLNEQRLCQEHLNEALKRCRSINYIPFEPSILLAFAKLALLMGDKKASLIYAEDAQRIAERAFYRLDLADIHNFIAELQIDTDNPLRAKENAFKAKSYASYSEPPFIYHASLLKAENLLRKLEN